MTGAAVRRLRPAPADQASKRIGKSMAGTALVNSPTKLRSTPVAARSA
jgi:hypothetical protein